MFKLKDYNIDLLPEIEKDKRIGIFLSGGMDSALLLYLIREKYSNKIYPLTVPKHDGAVNYIDNIISWIETKTNKSIEPPIIIGNPDLHHSLILSDAINRAIKHNFADLYFLGGNIYPESILPNGPNRIKIYNKKILKPLFDLYKSDILKLYLNFDLVDLIKYTHTCTEQKVGRCNVCWQCGERKWAFDQCGIEDTSTT